MSPFRRSMFMLLLLAFLPLACHISKEDGRKTVFSFPGLIDSLADADYATIVLMDISGTPLDTLFEGPVNSETKFRGLPTEKPVEGKLLFSITGRKGGPSGAVVYRAEKRYDSRTDTREVTLIYVSPLTNLTLKEDSLRIREGDSLILPQVEISPFPLVDSILVWISRDTAYLSISATHLIGKAAGVANLIVTLRSDTTKRDTLRIEVISRKAPRIDAGKDTMVTLGSRIVFTPKVALAQGAVAIFKWDLDGNGSFEDSSKSVPDTLSHRYSEAKEYFARFYVRDSEGNEDVVNIKVTAVNGRVVRILSPGDGTITNKDSIEIRWSVDGAERKDQESLIHGENRITRKEKDLIGNEYSDEIKVILDTIPPSSPRFDSIPLSPINSTRPKWSWRSGSGGAGRFRVKLDSPALGGAPEQSDSTFIPPSDLSEGLHTLYVQERDEAGNWSVSSERALYVAKTGILPGSTFPPGIIGVNSLAITKDGAPIIVYSKASDNAIVSAKYVDGHWYELPNLGVASPYAPSILLTSRDIPIVYFSNETGENGIRILKYEAGLWTPLGGQFHATYASDVNLDRDGEDSLFLAYNDHNLDSAVVMKLRGGQWEPLGKGSPYFIGRPYYSLFLEVTADGTPYTLSLWNSSAAVRLLKGNHWEPLGLDAFAQGDTRYIGFSVNDDGEAMVSYRDYLQENKTSVKHFNGKDWIYMGKPGMCQGI